MVQNNQITGFSCCFWGNFGTPKWTKKVHKGPQVGRMYGLMCKLKNKPLTNHYAQSFRRNGPKQQKQFSNAVFCHFVANWQT
jgi:hypothetical protein